MKPGLDELMIVNPGPAPPRTTWFLGADGMLYRRDADGPRDARTLGADDTPRFFLGDDGTLYERR